MFLNAMLSASLKTTFLNHVQVDLIEVKRGITYSIIVVDLWVEGINNQ